MTSEPSFCVNVRVRPEIDPPVSKSLTSVAVSASNWRTAAAVNSASRMMAAGICASVTCP